MGRGVGRRYTSTKLSIEIPGRLRLSQVVQVRGNECENYFIFSRLQLDNVMLDKIKR